MLKQSILALAATASVAAATAAPLPADARTRHYHHRTYTTSRVYRGRNGRYYCRRGDGTVGTIVGAGAGALVGSAITHDGLAGPVLGAVGGGLLGRHIGRHTVRCR